MWRRFIPDRFILLLLCVIAMASGIPAKGHALHLVGHVSNAAIFSLFFFHGLRLAHQAVWDGLRHWRLQLAILAVTFGALPLFGIGLSRLMPDLVSPALWTGVLFLCVLPSTVQAAIASASMARGNVAASVIASAVSNLSAVVLTPLLFAAIVHVAGAARDPSTIGRVMMLLLLPFILGQGARHWLSRWAERHRVWIGRLDRLTILITVYVAFSAAVNEGLWGRLDRTALLHLSAIIVILLGLAFATCWVLGHALGLSRQDRVTLFFSGAHKSLATGAPMARILFPAAQAGFIIIPLMIYHQLQLMVSAWIAAAWGKEA
jgi:solute carrier family 10 (sodium/bile acid cotransporter), member 7